MELLDSFRLCELLKLENTKIQTISSCKHSISQFKLEFFNDKNWK